jgi:hypothetical protein
MIKYPEDFQDKYQNKGQGEPDPELDARYEEWVGLGKPKRNWIYLKARTRYKLYRENWSLFNPPR